MKTNQTLITVLIAIIVGGAGFFGGMQFEKSKTASNPTNNFAAMRNGTGTRFGNRNGNGSGQVISQDSNSLTIKLNDGSSKIILLSSNTKFSKTDAAALSDIKAGDRIMVVGTPNSDGSETAETIFINPNFREAVTPTPAQ